MKFVTILNSTSAAIHEVVGLSEFLVNKLTDGVRNCASVAALAIVHFVSTWKSSDSQQGDTSQTDIEVRIFDAYDVALNLIIITDDVVTLIDTATLNANDSVVDGEVLTMTAAATSTHGAASTLNTNGMFSYDPTGADTVHALVECRQLHSPIRSMTAMVERASQPYRFLFKEEGKRRPL